MLRSYDSNMVQIAVSALLRESKYIDILRALDALAVEILVIQRSDCEDMEVAWAAGRVPPFEISWKAEDTRLLSLSQEAQRRGLGRPFFEHPDDRALRIRNEKFGIAMIFQPTGRAVTFRAPKVQLGAWELIQRQEQHTTNPPYLYWSIHTTNATMTAEFSDAQKIQTGPAALEGNPGTGSPPLQNAVEVETPQSTMSSSSIPLEGEKSPVNLATSSSDAAATGSAKKKSKKGKKKKPQVD
ncbi:hypothetical protein C8R46DRAFT_423555 [Mycena filopes]|nr:hypothetical protein C8R46DRAFT_423555 [Mycena filopes]